ncbi:hypothetical protein GWK47_012039 [Chionoecetes opilio]|uniref:Uncharacterized protein n=1 Tax=Chionoecetes opilio TaxID=41210 RepID=A0A8J5C288_CHIOP|nr:hypothetical protein GWK47_012039 [Chionoecetes opilio]
MWTSPDLISGIGGAQLLAVAKLGSGTGESMAAAVVSALETWGVADQVVGMSFDTTASNTGRRKRGLCLIEHKKGERPAAFRPSSPYPGVVVPCGCSSVFWVFLIARANCSSNASKLMGEHRPRGLRDGNHGGGSGDVLEDVKDEALRWTLQVLQEREDLRDDYREIGQTCHHFPRWCPSVEFDSLLLEQCTRPDGCQKSLLLQDLDVPGPNSA